MQMFPVNFRLSTMVRVTVIGAGIIGLPTAYCIQTAFPHARVTVVADKFSPNTTGDVAVGIWTPYSVKDTPERLQT